MLYIHIFCYFVRVFLSNEASHLLAVLYFVSSQDPTNLQGKIQKHQAFEAELDANESRIAAIATKGQEMIDAGHEMSPDIQARVDDVNDLWVLLKDKTGEKGEF